MHSKFIFFLVFCIGIDFCLSEISSDKSRTVTNRIQTSRNEIYPINKDAPYAPDIILVKRRSSGLFKDAGQAWDRILQSVSAVSYDPMFPSHRDDGTRLSKVFSVHLIPGSDVHQACHLLLQNSSVEWAEPVYKREIFYDPNDPGIGFQWYLNQVNARAAWDLRGNGEVLIGIVDTGVNLDHPDLAANIWTNPGEIPNDGIDNDENGYVDDVYGWDFGNDDNDPSTEQNDQLADDTRWHGTGVAGVASAVTDNDVGIAAPAFNAGILPVKVMDEDGNLNIRFIPPAIVYAAENGADIINCSFGGTAASNAEREAVAHACSLNVLIVAGAGHYTNETPWYPASFPGVLSVAWTDRWDKKEYNSNYGYTVDLTAPGTSIYSTNGEYGYKNWHGASFSTALTSSVAGLVKGIHPDWTGAQVGEQVRISADPIDDINPGFENKLGYGRVNAYRAMTVQSPSIRIADTRIVEGAGANEDGIFDPGEELLLTIKIKNYLVPATGILLAVSTNHPDVNVENSQLSLSSLTNLQEWENTGNPVRLQVSSDTERGQTIDLFINITADGGYQDFDHLDFVLSPYTIHAGNVRLTISSNGRLAFWDYSSNTVGDGFVFNGENLLFEGAVMAATGASRVSDVARGVDPHYQNDDFSPTPGGDVAIRKPGSMADEQGEATFTDALAPQALNIRVHQKTLAFYDKPDDDYILLAYRVENISAQTLQGLYFGLFMDWDVGDNGDNASSNQPGFDAGFSLGYIYDVSTSLYGGLQVVSEGGATAYKSIYHPTEMYDGYTDGEKWEHLSLGIRPISRTILNDYSHVLGVGPLDLAPGDTTLVGFAALGGLGLDDLLANAAAAREKWRVLFETTEVEEDNDISDRMNFYLDRNYPNPFNPETTIRYCLAEKTHVTLSVYDMTGREVARLVDGEQETGYHQVQWSGKTNKGIAPSGVYLYRIRAGSFQDVRKMILIR